MIHRTAETAAEAFSHFDIIMPTRDDVLSVGPAFFTMTALVFVIVAGIALRKACEAHDKVFARAARGFRRPRA